MLATRWLTTKTTQKQINTMVLFQKSTAGTTGRRTVIAHDQAARLVIMKHLAHDACGGSTGENAEHQPSLATPREPPCDKRKNRLPDRIDQQQHGKPRRDIRIALHQITAGHGDYRAPNISPAIASKQHATRVVL